MSQRTRYVCMIAGIWQTGRSKAVLQLCMFLMQSIQHTAVLHVTCRWSCLASIPLSLLCILQRFWTCNGTWKLPSQTAMTCQPTHPGTSRHSRPTCPWASGRRRTLSKLQRRSVPVHDNGRLAANLGHITCLCSSYGIGELPRGQHMPLFLTLGNGIVSGMQHTSCSS